MRAHNMPFDTHQFVKKAQAVGFTEQQAEFQAQELSHVLWDGIDAKLDNLVTKTEFNSKINDLVSKTEFNSKIENLVTKTEFNSKIENLVTKTEFNSKIENLVTKTEFNSKTENLVTKTEFNSKTETLENKIHILGNNIHIVDVKLSWLVTIFGVISTFGSITGFLHMVHFF